MVGICGLISSGKGECARKLVEEHGFTRISFGERLKDTVAVLFGWPRALLEGDTDASRQWREQPTDWVVQGRALTPRDVLQMIGTQALRNNFDPDIWTEVVRRRVRDAPDTNFVIDDVRFPNEIQAVREMQGGTLWHVRRSAMPPWWARALELNAAAAAPGAPAPDPNAVRDEQGTPIHISEWAWARPDDAFDAVILNDADLAALRSRVAAALARGIQ